MHRIAIIGCGRISYKGVEAIINNKDCLGLIALCDVVKLKSELRKKEYLEQSKSEDNINIYEDYIEMLSKEAIDIVYIATESGYHSEIAINCMKRGIHVIVEKPMALSTKDALEMIKCAKENGVKLCVSHQNRFNRVIQGLRMEIENGNLGKIINGTARILWNRGQDYYDQAPWRGTYELDGGTLMNQCIHNIDLLQWMMNSQVDTVYAQCGTFLRNIEAEDFGAIIIRFKNNAIGIVEGSACVYPENLEETLSLFGERGTVCIGGLAVNKIETWRIENHISEDEPNGRVKDENPNNVYGAGHTLLFKDMVNSIDENREPLVNGVEGLKALEIILAAYKSWGTGNPIKFPIGEFSTLEMKALVNGFDKK